MSLKDHVYGITGGASGIGLATAQLIAERGGIICIGDVDSVALQQAHSFFTVKKVPFLATLMDVSDKSQVESWVASIIGQFGRLDGAVNAAGIFGKACAVSALDEEEWHRIIAVNLTGCSIVNLTSIHGTKGMARHGAYGASKHGIIALTEAAAKENGDREIRVNAVAPGAIYTPMMQKIWDESKRPADAPFDNPTAFQRQGRAQEVASVIAFLLGPESTFNAPIVTAVSAKATATIYATKPPTTARISRASTTSATAISTQPA
ncbi:hypothetical protein E8E12_002522 [Didymella heteroderae]|uniref:Oxidoreductase n=1 Tax=Didymella heteroderae TaxID=1769908 RepID=A0A9P4WIT5_9PLEO|nr:hypothetical protein E8E12_002522 [Didymella heteroderae]